MAESKIALYKPWVGEEELAAIREVFSSQTLTEGETTRRFEQAFANRVGAKYAVAVPNCTIAMELALRVLNIGPGDEVVVPDFTYPATAEAVILVGATPVLVDVDVYSRNTTREAVIDAINTKTKAIIPVSWAGNPLSTDFYDFSRRTGIPLIEDAACSLGSEINGQRVGSIADLTCFSLHPRKIITTGEGGVITTDDESLYRKMDSFKHFGMERGVFVTSGANYKLTNILGAVGLAQLAKLERIMEERIRMASFYTQLLEGKSYLTPPAVQEGSRHAFQTYTVLLNEGGVRNDVISYLSSQGIESQIGTFALHMQPAFKDLRRVGDLSGSKRLFDDLLALPLHHELTEDDQRRVCGSLDEYFSEN